MRSRVFGVVVAALVTGAGCSPRESSPDGSAAPASFVNRVWSVAESGEVAPGELRVFLSDGTLVMASPQGTPALGSWSYRDGRLTMTEEGLTYDADILELTRDTFRVRIHSPGEPVEIRFAPADQAAISGESPLPSGRR